MEDPIQPLIFKLFDFQAAIWNIVTSDGLKEQGAFDITTLTNNWNEAMRYTWGITGNDVDNFRPNFFTDWQNGAVDKTGKTLNQRFPFKTTD